jgi:hypothetical protein
LRNGWVGVLDDYPKEFQSRYGINDVISEGFFIGALDSPEETSETIDE